MNNTDARLVRTMRVLAMSIGFAIAIAFPLGYWALVYNFNVAELDAEVRINADVVTGMIATNPQLWPYEERRLQALVDDDRAVKNFAEVRRIYDAFGHVLASSKGAPQAPTLSRSREFFDGGLPVGRVEIQRSLVSEVLSTLGVAVIGFLFGAAIYVAVLIFPMRALERTLGALRREKERLRVVVDSVTDGIITLDGQRRIEAINPAAERMFGRVAADLFGVSVAHLVPQLDSIDIATTLSRDSDRNQTGATGHRSNGSAFPIEFDMVPVDFSGDRKFILTVRDITERKSAEQRLAMLANYDGLTSLPNRSLFRDRLQQAMSRAQRNNRLLALMFLDLDRFKTVNDSLGHAVGDHLLQMVAERLKHALRNSDVVAVSAGPQLNSERSAVTISRLGGDEFTIIIEDLRVVEHVAAVAKKIVEVIAQPFEIDGHQVYTSASIGITIYPFDDDSIDGLVKNADTAMYRAKERGRDTYQFFTADMNVRANQRLRLESNMRTALERRQFMLHYQPKLDLHRNVIVGFEALLRWQHPEHGLVSPGEFIPLLEETGLIVPVGEWVVRQACAQAVAWQRTGAAPLSMAVNLSARQFKLPGLADTIASILQETGLDPSLLELELTESLLMEHTDNSDVTLSRLQEMGVKVSIDDFGTGYSSLAYLKRFAIGVLKIDRSFVREVTTDSDDAAIAQAVIVLAHSLKLDVVAEGVETFDQLAFLRAHDCDIAQGYFIGRPMDAANMSKWLTTSKGVSQQRRLFASS